MVFRYDAFYSPKFGVNRVGPDPSGTLWREQARFILAADRPTYIPWLSKQHTFITGQFVETWYPDLPPNASQNLADSAGRVQRFDNFFFLATVNWLYNGQLISNNSFAWDIDDEAGSLQSNNVFRYSRNMLFGLNAIWYLGRSGRNTDPFTFSRSQRINEIEASIAYEI